jgi:hypothetical protein
VWQVVGTRGMVSWRQKIIPTGITEFFSLVIFIDEKIEFMRETMIELDNEPYFHPHILAIQLKRKSDRKVRVGYAR